MTDRYTTNYIEIIDQQKHKVYEVNNAEGKCDLVILLNKYHERLQEKDDLLNKQLTVNNNLSKTIDRYENTLDNAIQSERTQLGQSVLKQYREAIQ